MRIARKPAVRLLVQSLLLGAAFPAAAVANPSPEGAPTVGEDIIVTAQKSEQSLQDVPISISVVSGSQLQERAILSVADLTRAVPGVNFQETNGATQITIRGVGLQVQTGLAEPNIALHIDGVFQPASTQVDVPIFDIERVEVLRGPQGTLYGRNATGGAINFITRKPTSEFEAELSLGTGSFNAIRANGFVSGPIAGDTLMGRISAYYAQDDGYYRNSFLDIRQMGFEEWGFRGAIRFVPADNLVVDLSGYHQRKSSDETVQTLLQGSNPFIDALIGLGVVPPGSVAIDKQPWRTAGETASTAEVRTTGATLDANWDISDALRIRSLTGFVDHRYGPFIYDGDGTSFFVSTVGIEGGEGRSQSSRSFTHEFNFSGDLADSNVRYVAGLFYFQEELSAAAPAALGPIPAAILGSSFAPITGDPTTLFTGLRSELNSRTIAMAAFGDVTVSLTDSFRLNAGARQTYDRKRSSQTNLNFLFANGAPLTIPSCQDNRINQTFRNFDYKIRAEYDVAPQVLSYVQYQTGFKDGGVNFQVCGDEFDPETIKAFEGGLKSTLLDGDMVLNVSAFHYRYNGLQVLSFIDPTTTLVENVDRSTIYGAEIEASIRASQRLGMDLGVALLHSRIDEFSSLDLRNPALGLQDLSGLPLPSAPSVGINLGLDYRIPFGANELSLRAETFFSSAYNFRMFDDPLDEQPAYTMTNLIATFRFGGDRYLARAFVKNLENSAVQLNGLFTSLTGSVGTLARPREFGVDLAVRF